MATVQHQPIEQGPYGILIEEDLIDDSTGIIPMRGLCTPFSLEERFARRLAKILDVEVDVREAPTGNAIDIFLSRGRRTTQPSVSLDEELCKLVQAMQKTLKSIAQNPHGPLLDVLRKELWDAILIFNDSKVKQTVQRLQQSFHTNQNTYDCLVTRMFGVDDLDDNGSTMDRELGDRIVSLSQNVYGFSGSREEMSKLVFSMSDITRVLLDLQNRLKYLLEKTRFAKELYELICTLGFPERAHSTFIRAARASPAFKNVTFHLRPSLPSKAVSFASPMMNLARPTPQILSSSAQRKEKSKRVQRFEAVPTEPTATYVPLPPLPLQPATSSLGPLMTAVQPYLPRGDRNLALSRLQSAAKQEVAQLVGTVLQKNLLSMQTSAWYAFGFVTTKDEEEERLLAGLYMALLEEADNSETIFRQFQTALESNTIAKLLDKHDYGHFRDLFPYLQLFLATTPTKRSTVWRLKQFIKDPADDEPPACLQRDYGFKFCRQREEVLRLKSIYSDMLQKIGPKNLHTACIHGRLSETAAKEGLLIDMKDRRFMQNDYPCPFVGLDSEGGLEAYRGSFYKRRLKL